MAKTTELQNLIFKFVFLNVYILKTLFCSVKCLQNIRYFCQDSFKGEPFRILKQHNLFKF